MLAPEVSGLGPNSRASFGVARSTRRRCWRDGTRDAWSCACQNLVPARHWGQDPAVARTWSRPYQASLRRIGAGVTARSLARHAVRLHRLEHQRLVAARDERQSRAADPAASIPTRLVLLPFTHASAVSGRAHGFKRKLNLARVSHTSDTPAVIEVGRLVALVPRTGFSSRYSIADRPSVGRCPRVGSDF